MAVAVMGVDIPVYWLVGGRLVYSAQATCGFPGVRKGKWRRS